MSSTATTGQRGVAKFFATVRSCGVERSQDRWFAGVCGGVAERLGLDPLLVRGVLVALTVVGGLGLAAYGACWLLLPDGRSASAGDGSPEAAPVPITPGRIEAEAVLRGDVSGGALLAGALVLADVVLPRALLGVLNQNLDGPGWGFLLTGLLALLGWWLLRDVRVPPLDPARRAALDAQLAPAPTDETARTQPLSLVKDTPATAAQPSGPAAGFGSPTERRAAARLAREQARAAAVHARTEEKVREAYEKAARARAARRPGSPLLTTATLGLALLAVGLVVVASLLTGSGPWSGTPLARPLQERTLPLAAATATVVLGLGAVLAGLRGRRTALVGLAWPVALAAAATALAPPAGNWTGDTDRTWAPTGTSALSTYVGRLAVDPGGLEDGTAAATVAAGRLDVVVPADRTVLLDVSVLAGSLRWQPGDDLVEVTDDPPGDVAIGGQVRREGSSAVAGGVNLRRVFAAGPGAAALAGAVTVRGDDPADWTVPAGTPRVRATGWTGEVRIGPAGSTTLEAS
ncbi:PspC domain-containing protein [Kineococcus endophyticus]|uniref:PspC domain-containing protein n=1 Tax=Kineococcus endophyticus TaxID=1181883 RepID=A0ABV3P4A0_9ACTN